MSMSQADVGKYKNLYLNTAKEYVKQMQEYMPGLVQNPDSPDKSKEIHRAAHSLTSQSLLMGYNNVALYASLLENIFRAKRDGQISLNPAIISMMGAGVNKLSACLDELKMHDKELDTSAEVKQLEDATRIKAGRKTEKIES